MARKSKRTLIFEALQKSERALSTVDGVLKKFVAPGGAPNFGEDVLMATIVPVALAYSQVSDAMAAIEATYTDPRFSTKEVATIRRMAAAGRPVFEIQKKLRRNINAIVAYMRAHGLQRNIRTALGRAAA